MNLLFDLDGTIVDSAEGIRFSLAHALTMHGIPFDESISSAVLIGPPLRETLEQTFMLVDPLKEQVANAYRSHHSEHGVIKYKPYPSIIQVIEALAQQHRLFVATAKTEFLARKSIETLGLSSSFEAVYGVNQSRSGKVEVIRDLLADFSLNQSETVMIGDKEADAVGALRNGIKFWGVKWGYGAPNEFDGHECEVLFEDCAALGRHVMKGSVRA